MQQNELPTFQNRSNPSCPRAVSVSSGHSSHVARTRSQDEARLASRLRSLGGSDGAAPAAAPPVSAAVAEEEGVAPAPWETAAGSVQPSARLSFC